MSYDDEDNLEALKKNNKKLLSQAVNGTGQTVVVGSALVKEIATDGIIIDNIDKNTRIAQANLDKEIYVRENYTTTWGWIKSWFKSKPKDAQLSDIDDRNTDLKVKDANKDYEESKEQIARNKILIENASEKDFKDTAYSILDANIERMKNNALRMSEEIDLQNKNFDKQKRKYKKY